MSFGKKNLKVHFIFFKADSLYEKHNIFEIARIPSRQEQHCIIKLKKLYETWHELKRLYVRRPNLQKEKNLIDSADDLFDIAHTNAMGMIKVQEDQYFLLVQREKGRRGSIIEFIDVPSVRVERFKAAKKEENCQIMETINCLFLYRS